VPESPIPLGPDQAAAIFADFAAAEELALRFPADGCYPRTHLMAMAEVLTISTRLLVVQEIREDERGTTLCFQQRGQGYLALADANYRAHLRLARRSRERQHPIGVSFGEENAATELVRAHNDVPTELWEEDAGQSRVLFQGHDGVFRLKAEHPEAVRLRGVLADALRQKARVWFIAQKPDLVLLDVQPAGCAA
jgi:hypothetical protein